MAWTLTAGALATLAKRCGGALQAVRGLGCCRSVTGADVAAFAAGCTALQALVPTCKVFLDVDECADGH